MQKVKKKQVMQKTENQKFAVTAHQKFTAVYKDPRQLNANQMMPIG